MGLTQVNTSSHLGKSYHLEGLRERCKKKTFSVAKSICESSLIQREIVTGQSIQHLHVSKRVTKVICFL